MGCGHRRSGDPVGADVCQELAANLGRDSGSRKARSPFKAAIRLERRDCLSSMLALARNLHPITDAGDRWDADPWLMGVVNGVVDLRTGRLRPWRPDDHITMSTAVPFDPDQPCPRWQRFVTEIFAADAAQSEYVQQAAGYSVTGDTSEQCLFLQDGKARTAKARSRTRWPKRSGSTRTPCRSARSSSISGRPSQRCRGARRPTVRDGQRDERRDTVEREPREGPHGL